MHDEWSIHKSSINWYMLLQIYIHAWIVYVVLLQCTISSRSQYKIYRHKHTIWTLESMLDNKQFWVQFHASEHFVCAPRIKIYQEWLLFNELFRMVRCRHEISTNARTIHNQLDDNLSTFQFRICVIKNCVSLCSLMIITMIHCICMRISSCEN